jgi:hypothetical protein
MYAGVMGGSVYAKPGSNFGGLGESVGVTHHAYRASPIFRLFLLYLAFVTNGFVQAMESSMTPPWVGLGGTWGLGEFSSDRKPTGKSSRIVNIKPGKTIQDLVRANPAGTTFVLQPGVYRMQSVIPKNEDVFVGQPGAILNGSNLITTFSQETIKGITYWTASGPSQPGQIHAHCETAHPLCAYPEDFFIDNRLLPRVASLSDVTTGMCYFDYSTHKVYFLDNPNGHVVETSRTSVALAGGDNVTIQGLVIEKYANPAQTGVIGDHQSGNSWIVQNNEVRLNHGTGIKVGNSARLIGNYIHENGQLGIFGTSGSLIKNNEIARNNLAGFSANWEAGGAKFGNAHDITVSGNYVHDNVGDGLWTDGDSSGGLYENNIVVNNAKNGIAHEISHVWKRFRNAIGSPNARCWHYRGRIGPCRHLLQLRRQQLQRHRS